MAIRLPRLADILAAAAAAYRVSTFVTGGCLGGGGGGEYRLRQLDPLEVYREKIFPFEVLVEQMADSRFSSSHHYCHVYHHDLYAKTRTGLRVCRHGDFRGGLVLVLDRGRGLFLRGRILWERRRTMSLDCPISVFGGRLSRATFCFCFYFVVTAKKIWGLMKTKKDTGGDQNFAVD